MDDGEALFELVESVILLLGEFLIERDLGEGANFRFDIVRELTRRIVLGVLDDECLVAPAKGHEVTDRGDAEFAFLFGISCGKPLHDVEAAVHFLVFNQRTTKNDVRNEDERDDVDGGLGTADETGDEKAGGDADKGGHSHPESIGEKHRSDPENGVGNDEVDDALDERKESERDVFSDDVSANSEAVMSLSLQEIAVADDLLGGVRHPEEEGGDEAEEEKGRNVKGVREVVGVVFGVAQDDRDQEGESGGLEQGRGEVGPVPQLAEKGSLELIRKADPVVFEPSRRGPAGFSGARRFARCRLRFPAD